MTTESTGYNQFTLRQAAQFDKQRNHADTAWTEVSTERAKKGISRRLRIASGEGKRGGLKKLKAARERLEALRGK